MFPQQPGVKLLQDLMHEEKSAQLCCGKPEARQAILRSVR